MKRFKKKQVLSYEIPEQHVANFYKFFDIAEKEQTYTAKYNLWKFIAKVLPGVGTGWAIDITNSLHPKVYQKHK